MTGMTAMVGLLGALLGAKTTGKGCDVDVCLHDVALHQLGYAATWFLNTGEVQTQQPRSGHFSVAPVQSVPTADGWIFIMCMTQKFWEALLTALGRTDLQSDPRFADNPSRFRHRDELTKVLDAEFLKHPTSYWLELLSDVLPVAPVHDIGQALTTDFVGRTGMVQSTPHPAIGELRVMASPIKLDGERPAPGVCSPLGADNDDLIGMPAASEV
jgi:crotonobetainyl-CoA:carnitine CoA-transferase CaiB-like acyl-CoA transferase